MAESTAPSSTDDDMIDLPPMLLGTFSPKIDAKGRVALPARFRGLLSRGLVLTRGQEHCVYVLPTAEFRRVAEQIRHTSMNDGEARKYLRVFLSGASPEVPDKQGRILIPTLLRGYAKLGDDIVIIGVGTRAEIWNREVWEAYLAEQEQSYANIADEVLPTMEF